MNKIFKENPILLNKTLAKILGLKEAIILSQIHYWLEINKSKNRNFHEGRYWTYNTINNWGKEFPFLSIASIKRVLKALRDSNILITGNFNTYQMDRTLWYSIDYEKLEKLIDKDQSNSCNISKDNEDDTQNEPMESTTLTPAIPETSTKTSTEISNQSINQSKDKVINIVRETDRPTVNHNNFYDNYKRIIKNCELNFIEENYRQATSHAIKLLVIDSINKNRVKIGDNYIPNDIIKEDINKLNFLIIDHAINKFKEASCRMKIRNTIAYLKTCIYNAINETKIEADAKLRYSGII